MAIDLDRGVTKRRHPSGFVVAMYKETPGHYFDVNEQPVAPEAARSAGFDVDALEKERLKQEKLQEARERIESQFSTTEADMERILNAQAEHYAVKHVGSNLYAVFDPDGNQLTRGAMSENECRNLLKELGVVAEDGKSGGSGGGASTEQHYTAKHVGSGKWAVVDPEGRRLTELMDNKQEAQQKALDMAEGGLEGEPPEE